MFNCLQWICQILKISGLYMIQTFQTTKILVQVIKFENTQENLLFIFVIGRLSIFNGVLVYVNHLHTNDKFGFIKFQHSNLSSWSPFIVKGYKQINKINHLETLLFPKLKTFQCYIWIEEKIEPIWEQNKLIFNIWGLKIRKIFQL